MSLIRSVSGVRGLVRADRAEVVTMTAEVAHRMGQAYAAYLARLGRTSAGSFLVGGRDGRVGGERLLGAFIDGVETIGLHVLDLGVVTTPGVAMMVKRLGAAGGVVITASHNPAEWNGIKLITAEGEAPTGQAAQEVFDIYDAGAFRTASPAGARPVSEVNPHEHHVATVLGLVDAKRIRGKGFKVVLDSINGAGAAAGRMLLERLGCRVVHLNAEPAATFAHTPEPVAANLGDLCAQVRMESAEIGFAQDPDADRLAIVDENGRFIGEEYTLALCTVRVFATRPGPAATNLSTSRMIDDIAATAGDECVVLRSAVGEANVVEMMKAHGCVIGGEGNGGVIDPRVVYVRDSLVAMALVLDLLAADDLTVAEAVGQIRSYAMVKEKITCDAHRIGPVLDAVRRTFTDGRINNVDGVRIDWEAQRKWVHVRGSNTEPVMRIIAEAVDATDAQDLIGRVRRAVE